MRIGHCLQNLVVVVILLLAGEGATAVAEPRNGPALAPALAEQTIWTFCSQGGNNCTDGANPQSTLIADTAGNLYGTTHLGGSQNGGNVFQLTPSGSGWTETVLYNFCQQGGNSCTDGSGPYAGLIMDGSRNLYGTTYYGGSHGYGTVFKLAPSGSGWTYSVLYNFGSQNQDGNNPMAGVTIDGAGNLYGTTFQGGNHAYGTVFRLAPSGSGWTYSILYNFCLQSNCTDGNSPFAGLIIDGSGNLYGTTNYGGSRNYGAVFKLAPNGSSWTQTVLYNFCSQSSCADGSYPNAGSLVMDGAGNLYGATYSGGASSNGGTVYRLAPSGTSWTETVLWSFCPQSGCSDGYNPRSGLIMDGSGNLYGTTFSGGKGYNGGSYGTAFKLAPNGSSWTETVLYNFCSQSGCTDGEQPEATLSMDLAGNLYGTTLTGGNSHTAGIAFQLASGADVLSVTDSGNGNGTVTSAPSGINCGSTCSAGFSSGTQVTLTASPASGSSFAGWSGNNACSGTGNCVVAMNSNQSVTATFSAAGANTLSVSLLGPGTVTSVPAGINCPGTCSAGFASGTQVSLTQKPASGWNFLEWDGACSGNTSCGVMMNANGNVQATFWTDVSSGPGGAAAVAPRAAPAGP